MEIFNFQKIYILLLLILLLLILLELLLKMATRMRVQKTKNDQYIITIPKAFAETFDFKQGTLLEFRINENGDMVLRKAKK